MGQVPHWQKSILLWNHFCIWICRLSSQKMCYSTTGAKFSGQVYHLGFTGGQKESVASAAASHGGWHPGSSSVPEQRQYIPSPQTLLIPPYYTLVWSPTSAFTPGVSHSLKIKFLFFSESTFQAPWYEPSAHITSKDLWAVESVSSGSP